MIPDTDGKREKFITKKSPHIYWLFVIIVVTTETAYVLGKDIRCRKPF